MFCGNCGEKLEDGAKFCGKCGQKVEGPAEAVAEDARTNPSPEFFPPDLICRDIKELGELLIEARNNE